MYRLGGRRLTLGTLGQLSLLSRSEDNNKAQQARARGSGEYLESQRKNRNSEATSGVSGTCSCHYIYVEH